MVNCTFTSVWDDGSQITTSCKYWPDTGCVDPEMSNESPDASLINEFITLENGEEIEICSECHSYVMKMVVVKRVDLSYGEISVCSGNCSENKLIFY